MYRDFLIHRFALKTLLRVCFWSECAATTFVFQKRWQNENSQGFHFELRCCRLPSELPSVLWGGGDKSKLVQGSCAVSFRYRYIRAHGAIAVTKRNGNYRLFIMHISRLESLPSALLYLPVSWPAYTSLFSKFQLLITSWQLFVYQLQSILAPDDGVCPGLVRDLLTPLLGGKLIKIFARKLTVFYLIKSIGQITCGKFKINV